MVKHLLNFVPPHYTYVEPFGGAAWLLFAKPPSPVEVYNDIDSGLVNFYRVLRDPEKFKEFYRLVSLTPYSREEFYYCRSTWKECENDVEKAYRWFVAVRMVFGGSLQSCGFGYAVRASNRGMAGTVSRWLSAIDLLPQIHDRLRVVQIDHDDFEKVIKRYDTDETFFYLDPPYVKSTRRSGEYYHEMDDSDHERLVNVLLNIKGMAVLSGYPNDIYRLLVENGWYYKEFEIVCRAAGRTRSSGLQGPGKLKEHQQRTEAIWINPRCVERLSKRVDKIDLYNFAEHR